MTRITPYRPNGVVLLSERDSLLVLVKQKAIHVHQLGEARGWKVVYVATRLPLAAACA
jgi:hypothetical protein